MEKEYGLIQWSDDRKAKLIDYADSKGTTWQDVDTQIEFLLTEINCGNGPAAPYAETGWNYVADYNTWKSSTTVDQSTERFCTLFERAGQPMMETRKTMANYYYEKYKEASMPTEIGNGDFVDIAIRCHKYFQDNNFCYNNGNKIPYPNGTNGTDCSAFVTWVLYEYGYIELKGDQLSMRGGTLVQFCNNKGFAKITDLSQVKAGDILIWPGHHTEIVYQDGDYKYTLNCGTKDAIRHDQTWGGYGCTERPSYAFRVPEK